VTAKFFQPDFTNNSIGVVWLSCDLRNGLSEVPPWARYVPIIKWLGVDNA
jgi:hypothetical protein